MSREDFVNRLEAAVLNGHSLSESAREFPIQQPTSPIRQGCI